MSLRLTTGFCLGLTLQSPASATRPTAGRVRAAVWNSLQSSIIGARVLDVFAGSGAVGIEALSRGARAATFVEQDREALRSLKINLEAVSSRAKKQAIAIETLVLNRSAELSLPTCAEASFDILWLDPPYALVSTLVPRLAPELWRVGAAESQLVVESAAADMDGLQSLGSGWELSRQKVYGKIGVSFYQRRSPE